MRILWVSHSSNLAGSELSLLESVKALALEGIEVDVALPEDGQLGRALDEAGVSFHLLAYSWWMSWGEWRSLNFRARRLYRNMKGIAGFNRLFRKLRPDLVITNTLTVPSAAIAAKLSFIPHIWYIREMGAKDHGLEFDFGEIATVKLLDWFSDRIIVNSHAVYDKFAKHISPAKLRLVYSAVEIPEKAYRMRQNGDGFRICLSGTVHAGKRQEDAIRALSLLNDRGIEIDLTLVGNEYPGYGGYLRKLSMNLGISGKIKFVPFTQNPFDEMAQSDLVLMCSKHEAFGRVTVEAMKLGRPVIGARSGGTIELIEDGYNGLLYEAGNVDELAEKIESLYFDRANLRRLGENARAWSTEVFSRRKYLADLKGVMREIGIAD